MENVIVAGASQLSGNLSSCSVTTTSIVSGRPSIWLYDVINMSVNNCTGEVMKYQVWSLSEFSIGLMIVVGVILMVILIAMSTT